MSVKSFERFGRERGVRRDRTLNGPTFLSSSGYRRGYDSLFFVSEKPLLTRVRVEAEYGDPGFFAANSVERFSGETGHPIDFPTESESEIVRRG